MVEHSLFVKIPHERIGVLVGPGGNIKKEIEKRLSVKLQVDSHTGDVLIKLNPNVDDPSVLFRAKDVVIAIGRGFSPERAFRLLDDEDSMLEVIDLREISGRSPSDLKRLKGRLIGKEGKARRLIEELTDTFISIYGHTVSIIGRIEKVEVAREAIRMLIKGSQHSTVYKFLHRKRRELKKMEMELWEPTESLGERR